MAIERSAHRGEMCGKHTVDMRCDRLDLEHDHGMRSDVNDKRDAQWDSVCLLIECSRPWGDVARLAKLVSWIVERAFGAVAGTAATPPSGPE
jgi:hypothetical protein